MAGNARVKANCSARFRLCWEEILVLGNCNSLCAQGRLFLPLCCKFCVCFPFAYLKGMFPVVVLLQTGFPSFCLICLQVIQRWQKGVVWHFSTWDFLFWWPVHILCRSFVTRTIMCHVQNMFPLQRPAGCTSTSKLNLLILLLSAVILHLWRNFRRDRDKITSSRLHSKCVTKLGKERKLLQLTILCLR